MKTTVYNLVWADDEIDTLLDDMTVEDMEQRGFGIIWKAHDGQEFEEIMKENINKIDAVILDANFSESHKEVGSETEMSGLYHSWSIIRYKYSNKIPAFLFTNRNDEIINRVYEGNESFKNDFPRYKRWFSKSGEGEFYKMLDMIKKAVDENNLPEFKIRNKYSEELNAASLLGDDVYDFVFKFRLCDMAGRLEEMEEPFMSVRRTVEKVFNRCELMGIIPPISNNINGTARYFMNDTYSIKDDTAPDGYKELYRACNDSVMPKPLARSVYYIVQVVQDASHSKKELSLHVDEYLKAYHDLYLLRAVIYLMIDLIMWFANIKSHYGDACNAVLWERVEETSSQ